MKFKKIILYFLINLLSVNSLLCDPVDISPETAQTLALITEIDVSGGNTTIGGTLEVGGAVTFNNLSTPGLVKVASGLLSSSLLVNADVDAAAAIVDTKLATISTAGKVSNSATTATSANAASAVVARDGSGNFSAGTITASLTGAATLNVLKAGDTMTGTLTHPAGTAASPSIQFTGSTNTGISAATADRLSFDTSGIERMSISTTDITLAARIILASLHCDQAIQTAAPASSSTVTVNSTTSILLLTHTANRTNVTITFPGSPTNGQFFSVLLGTTNTITLINSGNGASVVNGITILDPAASVLNPDLGFTSATYIYVSSANTWYRFDRG